MMAKLDRLIAEARTAAERRGHSMRRFLRFIDGKHAVSNCKVCGREVSVETDPSPNGIDIGGEAVAVGCSDA